MHDFNLVYITLFFVFSFGFSAGPMGVLNIGRLKITFDTQERIFATEEARLRFTVTNTAPTTAWSIALHIDEDTKVNIPTIKPKSDVTVFLPVTVPHRGVFVHDGCYLESKYPLSTARLILPVKSSCEGLAYPQPRGMSLHSYLNTQEARIGEEKEFDGLAAYDGTQKLSHLHWASVAKGEMSVKRFSREARVQDLNFDFSKIKGDTEARLSQLSRWVLECESENLTFGVILPDKRLHSHKESIDEILETLARY